MTFNDGLMYAMGILFLNGINIICHSQYFALSLLLGMKIRVALSSLIYRKTLKLQPSALHDSAVINLLSNDVNRFDYVPMALHVLWSAPLMTIIIVYALWHQARWAGIIGIAVVFIIVPIQCKIKKNNCSLRLL